MEAVEVPLCKMTLLFSSVMFLDATVSATTSTALDRTSLLLPVLLLAMCTSATSPTPTVKTSSQVLNPSPMVAAPSIPPPLSPSLVRINAHVVTSPTLATVHCATLALPAATTPLRFNRLLALIAASAPSQRAMDVLAQTVVRLVMLTNRTPTIKLVKPLVPMATTAPAMALLRIVVSETIVMAGHVTLVTLVITATLVSTRPNSSIAVRVITALVA